VIEEKEIPSPTPFAGLNANHLKTKPPEQFLIPAADHQLSLTSQSRAPQIMPRLRRWSAVELIIHMGSLPHRHGLAHCVMSLKRELLNKRIFMIALLIAPMFAAAGFSLIYLLFGGGLGGAVLIFIVAKMLGK
jgi:hypothetical protein